MSERTTFLFLRNGTYVGMAGTLAEATELAKAHLRYAPMVYRIDLEGLRSFHTGLIEFRRGVLGLTNGTPGRVRKWGSWARAMTEDAPHLSLAQRTALRALVAIGRGKAVAIGYTIQRATATTLDEMGLAILSQDAKRTLRVEVSDDGLVYPF